MALRWALAGTAEAEKGWRRLMGKAEMPRLVSALRQLDLARSAPAVQPGTSPTTRRRSAAG